MTALTHAIDAQRAAAAGLPPAREQLLCDLAPHLPAVVTRIAPPDAVALPDLPLARRLMELGFVAGEALRIIAVGAAGADPIAVRIGGRGGEATFALRRHEAAWVRVRIAQVPV